MNNQLHQNLKHHYILNKEQRTIVHRYFNDGLAERIKTIGSKNNKVSKGKWVSKSSFPAVPTTEYCKCGGQFFIPDGLPELYDIWGICGKCGAEL